MIPPKTKELETKERYNAHAMTILHHAKPNKPPKLKGIYITMHSNSKVVVVEQSGRVPDHKLSVN